MLINKEQALEQLKEHMSNAPEVLRDYVLRSYAKQVHDASHGNGWGDTSLAAWHSLIEGSPFWWCICDGKWTDAISILIEKNLLESLHESDGYTFDEVREIAIHCMNLGMTVRKDYLSSSEVLEEYLTTIKK
jgi:hypothetical protein